MMQRIMDGLMQQLREQRTFIVPRASNALYCILY